MLGRLRYMLKASERNTQKSGNKTVRRPVVRRQRVERSAGEKNQADVTIILITSNIEDNTLLESLKTIQDVIQVYSNEEEALTSIQSITDEKIFLVVNYLSETLLDAIQPFTQIDSVFLFSEEVPGEIPSRIRRHCNNETNLINEIKQARSELDKQTAAISVYNQAEKATRDLSRETGSFLFFQLFKIALLNMTKTDEAKLMMVRKCREYYRGNENELEIIDEFEETYETSEAIPWYTRESFVYKLINKALRTEDVDALYHFRFYIIDLCLELDKNFIELKSRTPENILRLYRGFKTSPEEINNFQNNIGNLISTNGYLSTSRSREVAYEFAMKPVNRPNLVKVLFQYTVDLTVAKKIIVADIAQYSAFPEEAEMLVDLGASFQIESCIHNEEEDLWYVIVNATDKGADAAAEYIEFQKAKMAESNISLMFGNLLVEMGEYIKAEKYFNAILYSSNPNDEEIACIYHNIGRAHSRKGEFDRALVCLYRSYQTHLTARPARLMSAAKTINAIGIVYSEQGDINKAKESFERALKLYKKTVNKRHADVGGTLINLANIHCQQNRHQQAFHCLTEAQKIYQRRLPANHPNLAILMNNFGNFYYKKQNYDLALNAFTISIEMKEKLLPLDHPDLARTAHNLAIIHAIRNDHEQADIYFNKAKQCALPDVHPFKQTIYNNITIWKKALQINTPITDLQIDENQQNPIIYF